MAGAQNCGFGRALIAGDTAYLLSDNTDLQPVRDGENFSLYKLIDKLQKQEEKRQNIENDEKGSDTSCYVFFPQISISLTAGTQRKGLTTL